MVKIVTANKTNKAAWGEWEFFLDSLRNSTPVDHNETEEQKRKRIADLEKPGNEEAWIEYYFPKYCFCKSARFQRRSFQRILKHIRAVLAAGKGASIKPGFFQRRAWFRGASKSTRRMMEIMYIMFVLKVKINMLLISKSNENATRLLDSYMGNLEANQRLINDYGTQEKPGRWTHGDFTTRSGCTFRAVGIEQNPRGSKNEELRINVLVFDDADDDEVCRNPERLQQRQDWVEQAAIPTVDISNLYLIFFDNNVIAEDSLAQRAAAFADDVETVNIRDENGKSSWPEKNSEEAIDAILAKISYESGQKEYFNNPMSLGKTFKEITWGKCPPLKDLPFVLQYADPATSNKDKPTAKSKANNSLKGTGLLGYKDGKFYLYTCYLDNMSNSNFIDSMYAVRKYVGGKCLLYSYIENNTLQDPFYEQVLLPLIYQKGATYGDVLPVTPDAEKKPEKWFRVEADLEPLVRLGELVFNQDEKNNPHMKRMEAQFLHAKPNSKELGGPDIIQGAVKIIRNKVSVEAVGAVTCLKRPRNSKRY